MLFHLPVLLYPLHHRQPVQLRHDDIHQHHIRLFLPDDIYQYLPIFRFSHNLQLIVTAHDIL